MHTFNALWSTEILLKWAKFPHVKAHHKSRCRDLNMTYLFSDSTSSGDGMYAMMKGPGSMPGMPGVS